MDSLVINTHYTIIESVSLKDEYIKRQSQAYLNKIVSIASKFGYVEVGRDKDLYEGKTQIGDIDLILKNGEGRYLLIEAKNHALPMGVYFKDIGESEKHLAYLQEKWEKKIKARLEHLKIHYLLYNIPEQFTYIVVSRYPEIISHYSELLILSQYEFEQWLTRFSDVFHFNEFYNAFYPATVEQFTIEELEDMRSDGLTLFQFNDPKISDTD